MGRHKKDYEGLRINNFRIIGDTGQINDYGTQVVLARNIITDELFTGTISKFRRNKGFPKLMGVSFANGKYKAQITINGNQYGLGSFNSSGDASKAYLKALNDWKLLKIIPDAISRKNNRLNNIPRGIAKTRSGTFSVRINHNGKSVFCKNFKTLPEAEQALEQAKQQLKETN